MSTTALEFASIIRNVSAVARTMGFVIPGFRSPPETDATRTIRKVDDQFIVAVRLRDRHPVQVACDVVDGLLVANAVPEDEREDRRRELLAVVRHLTGQVVLRAGEEPF